jgi:hypothetical protein
VIKPSKRIFLLDHWSYADTDNFEGMDMTYALLIWLYGDERVNAHINMAEYAPHIDPKWDPYSVVFNVKEIQRKYLLLC